MRGSELTAVMSVELPDNPWIDPYAVRTTPPDGYLQRAEDELRAILAKIDADGVHVHTVTSLEPAAVALVVRSAGTDLLVVGSRGRGGFRGMVMGSVSLQCVLHAHCPVAVIRPEPHDHEAAAGALHARHTLEHARQQTTTTFL